VDCRSDTTLLPFRHVSCSDAASIAPTRVQRLSRYQEFEATHLDVLIDVDLLPRQDLLPLSRTCV